MQLVIGVGLAFLVVLGGWAIWDYFTPPKGDLTPISQAALTHILHQGRLKGDF